MNIAFLLSVMAVPATGGIVTTYLWSRRKKQATIAARLARWSSQASEQAKPLTLLKKRQWSFDFGVGPGLNHLKEFFSRTGLVLGLDSGEKDYLPTFLAIVLALLVGPTLVAFALNLNMFAALLLGLALSVIPFFILKTKAESVRTKFCEQLPDSIDLMVAVLRSGHSVSQAVKSVSEELPAPCGKEFETILHKMNLGQPLSQSLIASSLRFRSYELDLIQRAVSIHTEVGGSLAELLEKTNETLRQRLKLARQLKVITSQSRLSAQIVGMLPIFLALALNLMSPGYLQVLIEDNTGRGLLMLAIGLEIAGIYILNRMSTMKI